jgi:thiol-disulfide isomerase/thioredoxin
MVCFLLIQESASFSLEMAYKPPVKSTVKNLHDRRFQGEGVGESSRSRSSQNSAHASGYAPPQSSGTAGFEQRMRNMLFRPGGSSNTKTDRRQSTTIPSNVVTVDNLREYKAVVGDESSRMVAVRFHATYCRACAAVAPHFYKLAKMNPDVVFVDVAVTESNASIHQGLGVPSLPYGHIYHPKAGLIKSRAPRTLSELPEG